VELVDLPIPESVRARLTPRLFENAPPLWREVFPRARLDGHKYQRGHVLVLGGAVMTGAARLAARAAARIGAGLVTLAAPPTVWPVYAASLTGTIVLPLAGDDDFARLLTDARRNAIILGPGAGTGERTRAQVLAALGTGRAVILDADALTSFAGESETLFAAIKGPAILTPHEGEFARLFGESGDKLTRARGAAKRAGAVILLKGADTVIAAPDGRAVINGNAPPTLATAGSGDVLTGLIAGLVAQGMDPFAAASAACWIHGATASAFGPGLIAEDLIDHLPDILREHLA